MRRSVSPPSRWRSRASGAVWADDDGALAEVGNKYLMRQAPCIGGGTVEIARNVVSERVLGMPREQEPRSHPRSGTSRGGLLPGSRRRALRDAYRARARLPVCANLRRPSAHSSASS